MRVLRSRRSLPAAPLEASAHSPEPLSPPITDPVQNTSETAATASSGTNFRRFSLRLANKISPQGTVAADEFSAGKSKRTSNVSVVGCSTDSREKPPVLQLRSRKRLRSGSDRLEEEEMVASFREGGAGDDVENKVKIKRGKCNPKSPLRTLCNSFEPFMPSTSTSSPHSESIEKSVDTNLNDSLITELPDGRNFCEEKKTGDELVVELGNFGRQDEGAKKLVLQDPLLNGSEAIKSKEKLAPKEFEAIEGEQVTKKEIEFKNINVLREQKSGGSQAMAMSRRETDRNIAIELAPKFAFFKAEEEEIDEEAEVDDSMFDMKEDDWPGPFSTAMKIIEDRESILRARNLNFSSHNAKVEVKIPWTPSIKKPVALGKLAPSLKDLCLKVLCDNSEEIESLEGLPDAIKHNIALRLCHSRKMSSRVLNLLTKGSPMEIFLSDCSWMTEKQFEEVFSQCNIECLKVLQLDFCGRCLPDFVLCSTISRAPNCLSSLNKLSLKGAYCLSNSGIDAIVASAPFLKSLNLSQCSLITSKGIISLAEKLKYVLQELYIDVCPNVDAMLILPALKKLQCLEVLSVAFLETVTDKFLKNLIPVSGPNMRGLIIAGCRKLTNASLKTIGENCPRLSCLDIQNLNRLNDSAIEHLANGGCPFQTLKICHSAFSDEALAAFIEASGATLFELVLNNIEKASGNTAIAISRRCSLSLRSLDLSFCRKMTDEALGIIVDSCSHLRVLKLFGCTQVTNFFLEGHSNSLVKIIGLKGSILDEIEVPDFS